MKGMAYIGKIKSILPIFDADKIVRVEVVCGEGGKWSTVMSKSEAVEGGSVMVFLPDAIVPDIDELAFLKDSEFRVKMRRFRGVPSEVVAIPNKAFPYMEVGTDITILMGVHKFEKPFPVGGGRAEGDRPWFIPKTDEPNFQGVDYMIEEIGKQNLPCYATLKYDGSSMTFFNHEGVKGVTSRNTLRKEVEGCPFWDTAKKLSLPDKVPPGWALQMELIGPKIQGNPLGLSEHEVRVFDLYHIQDRTYSGGSGLTEFCISNRLPMVETLCLMRGEDVARLNSEDGTIYEFAKVTYSHPTKIAVPGEGVVVRPIDTTYTRNKRGIKERISFKIMNLEYKG